MPSTQAIVTVPPDWVMLGEPLDDGRVRLWASKELNGAELRAEWERESAFEAYPAYVTLPRVEYFLTTKMRRAVIIEAPDYQTAFEELFRKWRPERRRRPEIEGKRAIEG